jgi:hypothetical protein
MLERFRWYRRLRGGHWERWCVDWPVCSNIWHRTASCSRVTHVRPTALCRGTPRCEDWR